MFDPSPAWRSPQRERRESGTAVVSLHLIHGQQVCARVPAGMNIGRPLGHRLSDARSQRCPQGPFVYSLPSPRRRRRRIPNSFGLVANQAADTAIVRRARLPHSLVRNTNTSRRRHLGYHCCHNFASKENAFREQINDISMEYDPNR